MFSLQKNWLYVSLRSPCRESCRRKCYEKFAEQNGRMIYQEYRNTAPEAQHQVLCGLIKEENKKTQRLWRNDEGESRKKFTTHYFLKEAAPEKEVCHKIILSTFGITIWKARFVSGKMPLSQNGIVAPDGRGRYGKQKKISPKSPEKNISKITRDD